MSRAAAYLLSPVCKLQTDALEVAGQAADSPSQLAGRSLPKHVSAFQLPGGLPPDTSLVLSSLQGLHMARCCSNAFGLCLLLALPAPPQSKGGELQADLHHTRE